jgi:hypothetical protein
MFNDLRIFTFTKTFFNVIGRLGINFEGPMWIELYKYYIITYYIILILIYVILYKCLALKIYMFINYELVWNLGY